MVSVLLFFLKIVFFLFLLKNVIYRRCLVVAPDHASFKRINIILRARPCSLIFFFLPSVRFVTQTSRDNNIFIHNNFNYWNNVFNCSVFVMRITPFWFLYYSTLLRKIEYLLKYIYINRYIMHLNEIFLESLETPSISWNYI